MPRGNVRTAHELGNLVSRGNAKYLYEDPDEAGQDQMRLQQFNDGTARTYSYDADGNTTAVSGRFTAVSYDNQGRLRQIVGTQTDDYWYDQGGLRVKKTENATGTPVTTYIMYEGNNPLMQEVYEGSTRKAVWFHIIAGEQILARMGKTYPSTTYTQYFYLDNLGSRRVVFDETGTVTNRFRYSAWGVATQDVGTDDLASFTGKDYDATGLIYFNARYYDPVTGRFLTEDPARKGGNWYAYCDNNPLNATDPTGRADKPVETKVGELGKTPQKTIPDALNNKLKNEGWNVYGGDQNKQKQAETNLRGKVLDPKTSPDWNVTSQSKATTYDVETPAPQKKLTDMFYDYSTKGSKPSAQGTAEKKTALGTDYSIRPRNPESGQVGSVILEYLDVNNDGYIDAERVP